MIKAEIGFFPPHINYTRQYGNNRRPTGFLTMTVAFDYDHMAYRAYQRLESFDYRQFRVH